MNRNLLIILGVLALVFFYGCSQQRTLVTVQEQVNAKWAQVQNQYQRRADLIPNLVETVKGAANFEKSTLEAVIKARSEALRPEINIDANALTPENLQRFEQAQQGLTQALSRLLVVAEQYPQLKSNQNFLALQSQLEGTENRISTERREFNLSVQEYNKAIRLFPNNLFAGMMGFERRAYFEAQPGSDKAPTVKF
jgi:LemA protein